MFCKVKFCRFAFFHVTKGHKCTNCETYGHGQMECYKDTQIEKLKEYYYEEIPLDKRCTVPDCEYKNLHTIQGHKCPDCSYFGHGKEYHAKTDESAFVTIKCPLCQQNNKIQFPFKKIFGIEKSEDCCVCTINSSRVLLADCGHLCICSDCANNMIKK